MLVNVAVRYSSVFVYYTDRRGYDQPVGTAFAVRYERSPTTSIFFLITARHVIEKARAETHDSHVLLRVNAMDGQSSRMVEWDFDKWCFHPRDSKDVGEAWLQPADRLRYDIAATNIKLDLFGDTSLVAWKWQDNILTDEIVKSEMVSPGDDIAIIGLYRNHLGREKNIPIVRGGIIAAMPDEPISTKLGPMMAYLVEARSIGGLSGSPAYWISGRYRFDSGTLFDVRESDKHLMKLVGIVHGHFDATDSDFLAGAWGKDRMNEGMSIVAPVQHVIETLEQKAFHQGT